MNKMKCLNKIAIFILVGLTLNVVQAKFPMDPQPCKYHDEECVKNMANFYVHGNADGDSTINLVKIDPLHVSEIRIKQGAESPVNIDLKFKNSNLIGLSHIKFYKMKGFGKDLTKRHEIHLKTGVLSLVGDYTIDGKVLILPISGKGKSNMTMTNVDVSMIFTGTPFEKNGATYMKINDLKLQIKPERLYYHFSNLFNGDKALGDNMNAFLNDNWSDIFGEVKVSIENAFARIFEAVISTVFTKYPYEKYFTE